MWFQEAKDLARELVGVVTGNEKEAELLVLDSSEEDSYARAVHWWCACCVFCCLKAWFDVNAPYSMPRGWGV
jgi:hypothetical protein